MFHIARHLWYLHRGVNTGQFLIHCRWFMEPENTNFSIFWKTFSISKLLFQNSRNKLFVIAILRLQRRLWRHAEPCLWHKYTRCIFHWHLHSLNLFLHVISRVFIGTVYVSPKVKLFRRKKQLNRRNECISRSSRINVYLLWRLGPQLSSNECTVFGIFTTSLSFVYQAFIFKAKVREAT